MPRLLTECFRDVCCGFHVHSSVLTSGSFTVVPKSNSIRVQRLSLSFQAVAFWQCERKFTFQKVALGLVSYTVV